MILSDKTIQNLIQKKSLVIDPLDPAAIQACSIDLSLGDKALLLKYWNTKGVLDFDTKTEQQEIGPEIIIPPSSFILATTHERIELPKNLAGFVEGRSSIGRMGLFIQNASVVLPGFVGKLTLELYNSNILPIRLQPRRKICQLVLFKMDQEPAKTYSGKYQGQSEVTPSKMFEDSTPQSQT